MSFDKTLEKKRELLSEIEATKKSIYRLHPIDMIQRERLDAISRNKNTRERYGADESKFPGHVFSTYHMFKETIARADKQISAFTDKKAQLDAKLDELQEELGALDCRITIKDLLPIQATYEEAEQNLAKLEGLVAAEEAVVADLKSVGNDMLAGLIKEKGDLLAAIACGEPNDEARLEALNLEIENEEGARAARATSIATSTQMIAGLQRKIELATKALRVAKRNHIDGLAVLFEQELEKAAGQYVKDAGALSGAYSRVIALASILEKYGKPKQIFGSYTRSFQIPSFILDPCTAQETPDKPGVLHKFNGSEIQEKIDAEVERLGALGLNVSVGVPAPL
ncbi:MAG: hypothetical protein AB7U29_04205 [Desulfobulbus sp.]